MSTPYSTQDRNHTEKAHLKARVDLYPAFFGRRPDQISYPEFIPYFQRNGTPGEIPLKLLDQCMAIDRIIRVETDRIQCGYVEYTVQERFERSAAALHRNISITHYNKSTANVSELYKLKPHYFVSGYFLDNADNDLESRFVGKAHVCNVARLLRAISDGEIRYNLKENHKNQDFMTLLFEDLMSIDGIVVCRIDFDCYPPQIWQPSNDKMVDINRKLNLIMQALAKPEKPKHLGKADVIPLFGEPA